MEFKRINKDTVTCIITEDDMDEQGLKLEDLFEKKKEAMEFLHEVMKKAEEEVDYKPTGSFMPMQITVLPDHSISLTLSENASASFAEILRNLTDKAGIKLPKNVLEDLGETVDEERINRLNEYLKNLKNLTNSVKSIMDEAVANMDENSENKESSSTDSTNAADNAQVNVSDSNGKLKDKFTEALEDAKKEKINENNRLKFKEYVFTFDDIRTVISFCSKSPKNLNISSSLYKNDSDGKYYLDLIRLDDDSKSFAALFTMAYEFGHFQASNPHVIAHYKENYDCLIKENALNELSKVC
ncbi:adaptor protein MecA [Butyrivibrio sp. YAB3001]|uniref:adaptor protein MecA n=1 Tax=Butyrivibrio sp. YAB3001 TaxID=1520812 RepID=UPI0008F65E82|nr:adaptor protein MecA [Butyrivibrio sp. YAB3001]SFB67168.1 adapter protein MecA 1/2 [Butyrivibrio sp. YAB3001]